MYITKQQKKKRTVRNNFWKKGEKAVESNREHMLSARALANQVRFAVLFVEK